MPGEAKFFNRVTPFKNGKGKISVQFNEADPAEPVEIRIYEDIGEDPWSGTGFTANDLVDALEGVPKTRALDLRLNCAGGSVWEGQAIKTRLDEWPGRKTASIDGMAASVASWLPMGCDEIRAPKHAQMFIHDAWTVVAGDSRSLREIADQLDKSSDQIADIYSRKTGLSSAKCRAMMQAGNGTLMTAEEALKKGFIDRLTDDKPVQNFTDQQVSNMRNRIATLWNSISAHKAGQPPSNHNTQDQMNRQKMIALLNKWGVKFENTATDDELFALIEKGQPQPAPEPDNKDAKAAKNGKKAAVKDKKKADGDTDEDDDSDDDSTENRIDRMLQNALKAAEQAEKARNELQTQVKNQLKAAMANRVKACVEADKIPAGQMNDWIDDILAAPDPEKVINRLENLEPRPPGITPFITVGDATGPEELNNAITHLRKPLNHHVVNRTRPELKDRITIAENSAEMSRLINSLKKIDDKGEVTGPIRQMWDAWATSPRNANTMSTDLLRQVILSEIMRAFKRQFVAPSYFAHTFQNVALEGNDFVKVPYYPLDTVASTEFKYANGYVVNPNAQTSSKSVLVGGKGDGTATAGSGRKYKALQFSAYEIRRQPWLNMSQLTVMAAEQLAIDVRADIMGSKISAANFGNAIWTGAAGGFDHTVVTQYLLNAAIKAFWPIGMRFGILATDYYTTLLADPNLSRFLEAGNGDALRQATVGRLYGFQDITVDPLIPIANYIRGGDGNVIAGADPNSIGFIAYPSAILIATAPIMPGPGVMRKLVSYEQVTDDQTGLTISYKYFGLELNDVDNEIIECTYGSDLGEVAALKRLTSAGV
jgi:ATP-dependent protease ClpP protease subunit